MRAHSRDMTKKKHWYKIHTTECPVCGKESKERTRVYGEPPKDYGERYSFLEYYDYCDV